MRKIEQKKQLTDSLYVLEQVMCEANLWSSVAPSKEALSSQMPFAYDTLRFEQWLQFVFIPKMIEMLKTENDLPTSLNIHPMAEQVWPKNMATLQVIEALIRLEKALNANE